jgi:hypothetical protein
MTQFLISLLKVTLGAFTRWPGILQAVKRAYPALVGRAFSAHGLMPT